MSAPLVDDATVIENIHEARDNGYDRVCAVCGVGTAGDGMDIHEKACPEFAPFDFTVPTR